MVEHHFRGSKMALWIDLIPKIHRPENLSEAYHLLDSYDNLTSYDSDGLDLETLRDLIRLYSPLHQRPSGTDLSTHNVRLLPSSFAPAFQPPRRVPTAASRTKTTARIPIKPGLLSASGTGVTPTTPDTRSSATAGRRRAPLSLSVTVGVGCSLLSLNVLVFAAIFLQRRRNTGRLEKRRRDHFDKEMSFYLRPPPEVVESREVARVLRTPPPPPPVETMSNGASTNEGIFPISATATPSHNSLQDRSRIPTAIGQTRPTNSLHHTTRPSLETEQTEEQQQAVQKIVTNSPTSTVETEMSPKRRSTSGLNSLPPHPDPLLHLGSSCEEDNTRTIRPILRTSLSHEKTPNNNRQVAKVVEPQSTRNLVHYALNSSTAV